ncbi:Cof-type HAD-IIB family hydrolase [Pasteurella bettyae]|uniref:Cof-like hydrolase n=1 Tax=Pasteurella bettyae CCUG 2042 TaxID=1095749 RepID=I3DBA2_9PAST|nr:Cof-type HAD-IIB family hydrolase [Pasteurella bettyae]EIJ68995.1 Cof-like hydrolase [Pasteurella bettyae CCUG 2042]SUB22881.1 putative bifunctional phosphatase/peptidyl-prolyl cis-trans isomerase [Pasteurella bettyae]
MTIANLRDQIKIVFFDIDETLIMKFEDILPDTVLPAIRKLKQNGIIPAIATGRSRCSLPTKIKQLIAEEPIELFVTMNGQLAVFKDQTIEKHPIPTAKVQKLVDFFDAHNISYAFVSDDDVAVSEINPKQQSALDPILTDYIVDKDYFKHHEVFQLLPFYDESQDELVTNAGILDGLRVVRWDKDSVDLFDAEGSKARGIAAAIKKLGFQMENVMAFGDGLNDLEMLSTVGVGVAMGNAHEDLKKVANYVTDRIENDGIYNFLIKSNLISE